jgi:hypothetical protein
MMKFCKHSDESLSFHKGKEFMIITITMDYSQKQNSETF